MLNLASRKLNCSDQVPYCRRCRSWAGRDLGEPKSVVRRLSSFVDTEAPSTIAGCRKKSLGNLTCVSIQEHRQPLNCISVRKIRFWGCFKVNSSTKALYECVPFTDGSSMPFPSQTMKWSLVN